jgi:hypothetical protein
MAKSLAMIRPGWVDRAERGNQQRTRRVSD